MTVFVIGGINQDIVATSDTHLRPGETLVGHDLNRYPGGKGANQAVAVARAGADVTMIGCTGDDAAGAELKDYLAKSGVDTTRIRSVNDAPTGTALIVVAGGENAIIVIPGANQHVRPADLADVDFGAADIVMAQFETPIETTLSAFRAARAAGARTVLNPSPVVPVQQALLEETDYLVINEHEFEQIFDMPLGPVLNDEAPPPERFHGVLVITLGAAGVLTLSGEDRIRQAGVTVEVLDSTGAGDCFVGYLAAGLHNAMALPRAIEMANAAAAISVTRAGAASSIPLLRELPGQISSAT